MAARGDSALVQNSAAQALFHLQDGSAAFNVKGKAATSLTPIAPLWFMG
jgi:hypothetical protein